MWMKLHSKLGIWIFFLSHIHFFWPRYRQSMAVCMIWKRLATLKMVYVFGVGEQIANFIDFVFVSFCCTYNFSYLFLLLSRTFLWDDASEKWKNYGHYVERNQIGTWRREMLSWPEGTKKCNTVFFSRVIFYPTHTNHFICRTKANEIYIADTLASLNKMVKISNITGAIYTYSLGCSEKFKS